MVSGSRGCVMILDSFPQGRPMLTWYLRTGCPITSCLCDLWAFFLAWAGLLEQCSPEMKAVRNYPPRLPSDPHSFTIAVVPPTGG